MFCRKKVILYGSGEIARQAVGILRCLDIKTSYCIDDKEKAKGDVRDIFTLLEERDDFFVWILKRDSRAAEMQLNGMGLRKYVDFDEFCQRSEREKVDEPNVFSLDPLTGYSFPWRLTKGIGVVVAGEKKEPEMTIAILGGSTSDPFYYTWRSWGDLLREKCEAQGRKVQIIYGACCGYSSAEELWKMIRDILPYQPDIVVSYSGVNDKVRRHPYTSFYMEELFQKLSLLQPQTAFRGGRTADITHGFDGKNIRPAERWITNERLMHAMAEEFGVRHIAILQPNLYCKKRGEKDEEVYSYQEEKEKVWRFDFQQEICEWVKQTSYAIDGTQWLDEIDGAFYDFCHLYEEGNRIIAERIYEILFQIQ